MPWNWFAWKTSRRRISLGEVDVPVLKGISLSIERGELVALMGASGSGKSTLMNLLGCLDRPTSGKYWLDGEEISSLSANERAIVRTTKLGFVFQSFNLLPRTTAIGNVLMPLDYSPTHHAASDGLERSLGLLERVGLADRLEHVPSQMSGGQQQRVAIARALVNQPTLLLADEPTGNLDSHTSVEILQMFQQLNAAGLTVILVTHDPTVAGYADRVIHVVDGVIVEDEHGGRTVNVAGADGMNGHERRDGGDTVFAPHNKTSHNGLGNGSHNGNGESAAREDAGQRRHTGRRAASADRRRAGGSSRGRARCGDEDARRKSAVVLVPATLRTARAGTAAEQDALGADGLGRDYWRSGGDRHGRD